jgi:hypothetical protein
MIATTYRKFLESIAAAWTAEGYEFDDTDLKASAPPSRWHEEVLIPHCEAGGKFGFATLQSMMGEGAHHGLAWYGKNFPGCLPGHCDIHTGRAIPRNDLRHPAAPQP